MNNLKIFENEDNNSVLDNQQQQNIKGGIRYFTNHRPDFRRKKRELRRQGISFTTAEHDGVFCVEW